MKNMETILNFLSSYHSSLATLITGGIAWYLYQKSKWDELKTAAKTIILEIKEAEKIIKVYMGIKNNEGLYPTDYYKVTPFKAWDKYSHLFIKKLNNDEYEQINDFYKKCDTLEKYIEKNYNFFWITTEERAKLKERIGMDFSLDLIRSGIELDFEKTDGQYRAEVEKRSKLYMSNTGPYSPAGIKTEIDKTLNSINLIINTPTWNNIKKIAGYKDTLG
jgi:hypothetical protein